MNARVLVVEDDRAMRDVIVEELGRRSFDVHALASADEAMALLTSGEREFDVLVTDLNMPGMNGVGLCERVVANRPDVPVIVITAFGSMQTAIATLRAGAFDFLTKPFDLDELALSVDRALQHRELREEVKRLRRAVETRTGVGELLGNSPEMQRVVDLVARVSETDASVLVTGETGVGKELVARAVHQRSRRAAAPFVTVDCASMTEPLLDAELFSERRGAFVTASGGTLFLDALGEMAMATQAKLLRVLDQPLDVRVIAATNVDLGHRIEDGLFREELHARIDVVQIEVPPLRVRGTDVLLLAQAFVVHFAEKHGKPVRGLSPALAERFCSYSWPGNVRELKNCVERAVTLTRFEELMVEDAPEHIRDYRASHVLVAADNPSDLVPIAEVERRYIERVLEATGGNKRQAARILGLDRATLYRKLDRYGFKDAEAGGSPSTKPPA